MNDNLQILSHQSTLLAVRMAVVLTSLVAQDAYALSRWPQAKMSLGNGLLILMLLIAENLANTSWTWVDCPIMYVGI